MKINKDLNWNKFFIRFTTLLSIIAFIIAFISSCQRRRYGGGLPRDRSIGVFTTSDLASAIVLGLLFAAIVWGLYYAIRWIYKGLHNKDER